MTLVPQTNMPPRHDDVDVDENDRLRIEKSYMIRPIQECPCQAFTKLKPNAGAWGRPRARWTQSPPKHIKTLNRVP